MPNYIRWRNEGGVYFFTIVTYHRRKLFADPRARRILRHAMAEVRKLWPFDMFACVLLPDHFHCIWNLPPKDDLFSRRWAKIKSLFTKQYLADGGRELAVTKNREKHHERGIWQSRFWEHWVRDEQEMLAYRDYIHLNPVKHGYVRQPTDWPWSSVHRHLKLGWLESDWTSRTPIDVPDLGE